LRLGVPLRPIFHHGVHGARTPGSPCARCLRG